MSDSMEREKNERLTEKEIEEKNMKKQLIDLGIYDEMDTYEQMKDLIGFLNNSETTPNVATDNKHTHKKDNEQHSDNECLSEVTSETDVSQEQQVVVAQELSKGVACKPSRTSPQQECRNSRRSSSPDSSSNSSIFDARSLGQGRKGAENDETASSSEKQQSSANCPAPSKLGNDAQECQSSPTDVKMQCATQSTYYQRMERWRMNPLDVCINENDVPLQQPRSRFAERKSSGCHDKTSEQHDQKMKAMGRHLTEMADLWYSWQRPANAKFEWGAPIEVGTANGSLDRTPITEPKTEPFKTECAYRDSYERSSKRKANSLIAKECASLNKESSSDEDDQYEFARVKKKKILSDQSSDVADRANRQTSSRYEAVTLTAHQQHFHNDDDDNSVHIDDEDVRLSRRRKTENEENDRISPVLTAQPKRTVPSTPKSRPHLPRLRRGRLSLKIQRTEGNREMERTRNQKKDNVMTDEEIRRKLEEDSDGEEVAAILQKDMETRSPKEAKSQLQERQLLANNGETLRETSTTYQERKSNRQRSSKEKKVDFGEQRKKEDNCEIKNKGVSWEHDLLDDDEEINQQSVSQNGNWREKVNDSTKNISCPICNKPFPPDEIENHAADCDQFEINDEEDDDHIDQFKCNICDNYKTRDELEYRQHVRRCIESRKNEKHLHGSDDDVVHIPSPHRTHKLSRHKGASSSPDIDVMGQSPSHSRTRVFTNRKRKH